MNSDKAQIKEPESTT